MNTARVWGCGLLAGLLLSANFAAHAAVVTGLYEASVPVADQSQVARRVALQQALAAVLVKITGERTAGGVPALANLIQDPNQFLQQYRYEQPPGSGTSSTVTYYDLTRTGVLAIAPTGLLLSAKFDPEVVNHAVRAAGEPLWGQERPATLVWLAIQNGAARSVLASGGSPAIMQAMTDAASQRGVPLIFPLMDLRDQQLIGFPDIWSDDSPRIQQASQRYQPDAILVGSFYAVTPGQYAARWQLIIGSEVQAWDTPPGDLATVAADGIQTTADHYAGDFAIAANAAGLNNVEVVVDGVSSVVAYAKVLAYLNELTPVKALQVTRVENGSVYFSVDARGDLNNLRQAIILGDLLKPLASAPIIPGPGTAPAPAAVTAPLRFRYVP
ncbi:MAG: DUF2066 domain-containing protein [Gammaproteobacteria bacterium]|nr:DUF2066 domain-containing protein [Gammaproteobacteria bacterium]